MNRIKVPENLVQMVSFPSLSSLQGMSISAIVGTALSSGVYCERRDSALRGCSRADADAMEDEL